MVAAHSPTADPPAPRWSLLALRPCSPFRPPNWRALLAAEIAGHPDPRVAAWLARQADGRVRDLVTLGDRPPPGHPLAAARGLLSPDRHRVRVEVEARLLAGQSDGPIAAATGVGAAAVGWFHDATFDCRPRLRHPSAIVHAFLGRSPREAGRAAPPPWLVRWYAYFGGVPVLEELLRLIDDTTAGPASAVDQSSASLRRAADRAACRAAMLARLLPEGLMCRDTALRLAGLRAGGGDRAGGRGWMEPLRPSSGLLPNPAVTASEPGESMGGPVEIVEGLLAGKPNGATQRERSTTASTGVPRPARAHPLREGRL